MAEHLSSEQKVVGSSPIWSIHVVWMCNNMDGIG